MNDKVAVWRVYYRPRDYPESAWLVDGDYDHAEAVRRVFEIRDNSEDGEWDAYTNVLANGVSAPRSGANQKDVDVR